MVSSSTTAIFWRVPGKRKGRRLGIEIGGDTHKESKSRENGGEVAAASSTSSGRTPKTELRLGFNLWPGKKRSKASFSEELR
jgi:hypothetical protein